MELVLSSQLLLLLLQVLPEQKPGEVVGIRQYSPRKPESRREDRHLHCLRERGLSTITAFGWRYVESIKKEWNAFSRNTVRSKIFSAGANFIQCFHRNQGYIHTTFHPGSMANLLFLLPNNFIVAIFCQSKSMGRIC